MMEVVVTTGAIL